MLYYDLWHLQQDCFLNQRKKLFQGRVYYTKTSDRIYPQIKAKLYIGYVQTPTLLLSRMFKNLLKTSISVGAILFIQTDPNGCGYVYWKYWGSKPQEYSEIYKFVFTS